MWRVGFPTPKNENDNALYCGGFGVQHNLNGGKCGICGDPWNVWPRQNEAPHGVFATGVISKTYRQGSIIPVVVDITANHQGYFTFKLCPNNDIWQDPKQDCFDRFSLVTGKAAAEKYYISDYMTGMRLVYVHLPHQVSCDQCILQWTYTAGNNWGVCSNGTGSLGCGPQETFRSCSDIRILPGQSSVGYQETNTFSQETTFDIDQFEDYYDELFGNKNNDIAINNIEVAIDDEDIENEILSMHSVQTQRLRLLKKKLILAKALKSLRKLIMLSKLKGDDADSGVSSSSNYEIYDYEERQEAGGQYEGGSTIMPWWTRSNSHGRRKRKRRKRFSFWQDLLTLNSD